MQIGRLEPDPVEEGRHIPLQILFHQAAAFQSHFLDHSIGFDGGAFVPRIEAAAVGTNLGQW